MGEARRKWTRHVGSPRPNLAELNRQRWADPEWREKKRVHGNRRGTPHGMKCKQARAFDELAGLAADSWIMKLEKEGVVPAVVVPDSDDAIAKATLREAAKIALGVGGNRDRLAAINICLQYTKQKPVTKAEVDVKRPEDWLEEALLASKRSNGETQ
jgi:hypothetical protein